MLNFKKIEIDDIETYKKYTSDNSELSCENSFVNLIVWQCTYNNMLAVSDGQLYIKSGSGDRETFRLPFGSDFEKGFFEIQKYCGDKSPVFWAQEGPAFELLKKNHPQYRFFENRDAFDYIYLQSDLSTLSGKKYHSKRNHINSFSKKYDWKYEKITPSNIDDVKKCAEQWYRENTERLDSYMMCEKRGVDTILSNMDKLNVTGGVIIADGKVVAFTLGSEINSKVFDIHIEKALRDYAEAYTVINQQFAQNELSAYKYINREDDMGLEGLRKAKLSLKPFLLLKKYRCSVEG